MDALLRDNMKGGFNVAMRSMDSMNDAYRTFRESDPETTVPWLVGGTEFASSFFFGAMSGFAARRFLKTALVFGGVTFVVLQIANEKKYATVNWESITEVAVKSLDMNGDGQLDEKDFEIIKARVMKTLVTGVPSAAGFGLGFHTGLKGSFLGINLQ